MMLARVLMVLIAAYAEDSRPPASGGPNITIVNGQPAVQCAWNWQVGLKLSRRSNPGCGGTLIDPETVLTAAHCLAGKRADGIYVVAGEWNLRERSGNEQVIRSTRLVSHPDYDPWTLEFDLGLIKLSEPMQLCGCVGTADLPDDVSDDIDPGEENNCWITGWGTLRSGGSSPNILQEAQVNVMSNDDCWQKYGYSESEIKPSMLCAQGVLPDGRITDACAGDSGGPLVCERDGVWKVYGATSWGYGCASQSYPGIWARVAPLIDWIQAEM